MFETPLYFPCLELDSVIDFKELDFLNEEWHLEAKTRVLGVLIDAVVL